MSIINHDSILEGIKSLDDRKTVLTRLAPMVMVSKWVVLPILVLVSIMTEFQLVWLETYMRTQSVAYAALLTFLVIFLIEGLKMVNGMYSFRFFTQGWIANGGPKYLFFCIVSCVISLIAYGASFMISVKGAPTIAQNWKEITKPSTPMRTDSIQNYYDQRAAPIQAAIADASSNKWKGKTTGKGLSTMNQFNATLSGIEAERSKALEHAALMWAETTETEQKKTANYGAWLQNFAGISEVLSLLILFLVALFEKYVAEEELKTGSSSISSNFQPTFGGSLTANSNNGRVVVGGLGKPDNNETSTRPMLPQMQKQVETGSIETPVSRYTETVETAVPQQKQVFRTGAETGAETVRETVVVTAPAEDVSKWKKYAATYYKRSRNSATAETRASNYAKFLEYAELLHNNGISFTEGENSLLWTP